MIPAISVVAGGWSVRNIDKTKLVGTVIAVNDSAVHLPRWDYAVSMDRLWVESRHGRIFERARETSPPREVWLRRSAVQNLEPAHVGRQLNVRVFESDHLTNVFPKTARDEPPQLNGMNSGICALNLAHRLRPRVLYLLGFDMNLDPQRRAYWYAPYSWASVGGSGQTKYSHWSGFFPEIKDQFEAIGTRVYNVSPWSSVNLWPKLTPQEYASTFDQS